MKFGFYTGLYETVKSCGAEAAIKFMKDNGFTHCEPVDLPERSFFDTPDEAKGFKTLLYDAGLACDCYSVAVNVYPDPVFARDFLKKKADIAAAIGAKYLHHTVYMPLEFTENSPKFEDLLDTVIPYIAEVVRYAATLGLEVIYEPQGKYVNGMAGYGKFFDRLKMMPGCDTVGVCFDNGNVIFGGADPYEFLKKYLPYVRSVHIKDYGYVDSPEGKRQVYIDEDGRYFEDVRVGDGMMRCRECVELLEKSGYSGVYSLESYLFNYEIPLTESNIYAKNLIKSYT